MLFLTKSYNLFPTIRKKVKNLLKNVNFLEDLIRKNFAMKSYKETIFHKK